MIIKDFSYDEKRGEAQIVTFIRGTRKELLGWARLVIQNPRCTKHKHEAELILKRYGECGVK